MKDHHPANDDWIERRVSAAYGPAILTLNASERCNLECFMCCYSLDKIEKVRIDVEGLEPFLQKAEQVYITGGEPFWTTGKVNKKAGQLFERITDGYSHLKVNVFSNGVLFGEKWASLAIDRFESIIFSVDTLDPALYERIRGKPLLGRVLENIKALKDMKEKKGLGPRDFPHIKMNTIVMESTFDSLPRVAKKLADLGGYRHSLLKLRGVYNSNDPIMLKGEMFAENSLPKGRLEKVKKELAKVYSKTGLELDDMASIFCNGTPEKPKPGSPHAVCPQPWISADFRPNGDVYFCCASSTVMGNICEEGFDEIWNGKEARAARESFIRGEMTGCAQAGCPAPHDYFTVTEGSYIKKILSSLEAAFTGFERMEKIVFVRTARMHLSHLTLKTLQKNFPDAQFTVITNPQGAEGCREWNIDAGVLPYPDDFFKPEAFRRWWQAHQAKEEYSLAVAIYNSDDRKGYGDVEEVIRSINARRRLGIMPGGNLVNL